MTAAAAGDSADAARRLPALATWIASVLATILVLATVGVTLLIDAIAASRADRAARAVAAAGADGLARSLERGMFERWREIMLAAQDLEAQFAEESGWRSFEQFFEPLRRDLARMRASYPLYSWLGLAAPDGRLVVSTLPSLEGASMLDRLWFRRGVAEPFVGDVRDAGPVGATVVRRSDEPVRFIDLAAPITKPDGSVIGVLGAHLNWEWGLDALDALARHVRGAELGTEGIIARADGSILLGPMGMRGQMLPAEVMTAARNGRKVGALLVDWFHDGRRFYVGYAATGSYETYPGLGWIAVTRMPEEAAMAEVRAWQQGAVVVAAIVLVVMLVGVVFGARAMARPVVDLADAADAATRGHGWKLGNIRPRSREIARLAGAVDRLVVGLERLVAERTRQLRDALATSEAERAEADRLRGLADVATAGKSAFLATMSHEIRSPLNAVLGFTEVIARTTREEPTRLHARRILDTGETLRAVLDDILDLSKIEAGKLSLDPRPFRLREMIESCSSLAHVLAENRGIDFQSTVDPALPDIVTGDSVRLRQIVTNFVTNAVKFTPAGRVWLSVRGEPALGSPAGPVVGLRFEVGDTGIGIPPEKLERLFAPFEQGSADTATRFGGTGLGLVIARNLAEAMGGRVEVRSRVGEGSVFACVVPLPVATAVPLRPAASTVARRPLRVLTVDDVEINRAMLRALLAVDGHACEEAVDGTEAVEAAARGGLDLILMDRHMPLMDGLEATRRIRALPGPESRVPIYGLTGDVLGRDLAGCLEAGMDGVLAKPVRPDQLATLLAAVALTTATPAPTTDAVEETPAMPTAPPPVSRLDDAVADVLKQSVGEEAFLSLMERYSEFAREKATALRVAAEAADRKALYRTAHMLVGSAGSIGFTAISDEARSVEDLVRGEGIASDAAIAAARQLATAAEESAEEADALRREAA
ncbi:MAG: ATP-binding protein [Alphaproteobacteria bacterium]